MREIRMLQRLDKGAQIRFSDISVPGFDASSLGLDWPSLMKRIHGRLPNGELIEGVEVFRRLYAAVGFRRLVGISRIPGVSGALDLAYEVFAKNRLRLTGRCEAEACELSTARPSQ
jgi:predicted DCC family thiol-disulfide oxidoreductase YuxK